MLVLPPYVVTILVCISSRSFSFLAVAVQLPPRVNLEGRETHIWVLMVKGRRWKASGWGAENEEGAEPHTVGQGQALQEFT